VRAPGPGHSKDDRSLSVRLDDGAPDGFLVNSFSTDNSLACKDYVREKLGLPAFEPNGGGRKRASNDDVERALMEAVGAQSRDNKPKGNIVATYPYKDRDGELLYQTLRYEPKDFRQRWHVGNDKWSWKMGERRVVYRWPELLKYPDATVFICEGEKDADRVASLDFCATTVASGKWTDECVQALAGRDIIILEDKKNGRKRALAAARALHGVAKTIRIVLLPDIPEGKNDVSDWLDEDPRRANTFAGVCCAVPEWEPSEVVDVKAKASPNTTTSEAPTFSDEALALYFGDRHAGELRYVAAWAKWMLWASGTWQVDHTRLAFSLAREVCRLSAGKVNDPKTSRQLASAKTRAAVITLAGDDRRLAAASEQWDADPDLFNTKEGI
jgi:hypothetical protein